MKKMCFLIVLLVSISFIFLLSVNQYVVHEGEKQFVLKDAKHLEADAILVLGAGLKKRHSRCLA